MRGEGIGGGNVAEVTGFRCYKRTRCGRMGVGDVYLKKANENLSQFVNSAKRCKKAQLHRRGTEVL